MNESPETFLNCLPGFECVILGGERISKSKDLFLLHTDEAQIANCTLVS